MPRWQEAPPVESQGERWRTAPPTQSAQQQSQRTFMQDVGRGLKMSAADLYRGITTLPSMPFDLFMAGYNRTLGPADAWLSRRLFGTNRQFTPLPNMTEQREAELQRIGVPQPETGFEEAAGAVTRGIGAGLSTLGLGGILSGAGGTTGAVGQQMIQQPVSQLVAAGSAGASSDVARQMGGGPLTQFGAGLMGGMAAGGISGAIERGGRPPAPSIGDLRNRAGQAYQAADDAGVIVSRNSIGRVAADIEKGVRDLGYDPGLNPEITAALTRIARDSADDMSLSQLEILRRVFKGAAESQNEHTQKLAYTMIGKLDDFVNNLTAQDTLSGNPAAGQILREARNLYSRSAKGEELALMMENARIRAPNFSASGYENALRTEFRRLATNQNRLRMFNAAEQEAIKQVATGGSYLSVVNALRLLGKLAPTGVVSGGAGVGLGYLAGGPAGAVALPMLGGTARLGATGLTIRNANLASELVRRGAALPPGAGVMSPNALLPSVVGTQSNYLYPDDEEQRNALYGGR